MNDLFTVLQRKRAQLDKLKQDIATLEAAEALLATESETPAAVPPRPQAMAAVASVTDKSEKVASRFP